MKLKFIAVMATGTTLLASGAAYAAETFVGPSLALGLTAGSATADLTTSNETRQGLTQRGVTVYQNSIMQKFFTKPMLDASYGIPLSNRWVVTLGANYSVGRIDAGTTELTRFPAWDSYLKLKNHMSVYVAPGMRFGEEWLVYGKLGYHQATAEFGEIHTPEQGSSAKLKGVGIGIGANYALARNVDLRMELEYVKFDSYTRREKTTGTPLYTGKPDMRRANVLLGYRF